MKYTRYDLTRNKRNNRFLLLILTIIILIAFIIGSAISKFVSSRQIQMSMQLDTKIENFDKRGNAKFVFIKCNDVNSKSKKENTMSALTKLGSVLQINENKSIIIGIFNEDKANKISKQLKKSGINNEQQVFEFKGNNLCNIQIAGILNANIQILNKLLEKNVQAVRLQDLKKWVNSLDKVDSRSKNIKILMDMKNFINKLPNELKKERSQDLIKFMYNELYKVK